MFGLRVTAAEPVPDPLLASSLYYPQSPGQQCLLYSLPFTAGVQSVHHTTLIEYSLFENNMVNNIGSGKGGALTIISAGLNLFLSILPMSLYYRSVDIYIRILWGYDLALRWRHLQTRGSHKFIGGRLAASSFGLFFRCQPNFAENWTTHKG